MKQAHDWWQYDNKGKLIIEFLSSLPQDLVDPIDGYMHDFLFDVDFANDFNQARTSSGFSPQFVHKICLENVFRADYKEAQFNQALTALDYLRDLECTRRTALHDTAVRLGITKEDWRDVLSEEQEAYTWVESVQQQELVIESHYANVFIDLRIWVSGCGSTIITEDES